MSPDDAERTPEESLARRDREAEANDETAAARDRDAAGDDLLATARDRAAELRDAEATGRDRETEADRAPADRQEAAEDRQLAAQDRDRAHADRTTSQQHRQRAEEDRSVAHSAVAQLRALLFKAEDDVEAMAVIGQAQGMIMAARGSDPLEALLELSSRAARDNSELHEAARSILRDAAG